MNVFQEVVNTAVLRLKWTEAEGGRILDERPLRPHWAFVEVLISRHDFIRLRYVCSGALRPWSYLAEPLRARARDLLASVKDVQLALGSEWEHWIDEDGQLFRYTNGMDTFAAYYGVPTQARADELAARRRRWELEDAAGLNKPNPLAIAFPKERP